MLGTICSHFLNSWESPSPPLSAFWVTWGRNSLSQTLSEVLLVSKGALWCLRDVFSEQDCTIVALINSKHFMFQRTFHSWILLFVHHSPTRCNFFHLHDFGWIFFFQKFKELQSCMMFLPTYTNNWRSYFCLEPNTRVVEARGYQGSEVYASRNDIPMIFLHSVNTGVYSAQVRAPQWKGWHEWELKRI